MHKKSRFGGIFFYPHPSHPPFFFLEKSGFKLRQSIHVAAAKKIIQTKTVCIVQMYEIDLLLALQNKPSCS